MKKLSLLAGLLAMGVASLQASSPLISPKTTTTPEVKKAKKSYPAHMLPISEDTSSTSVVADYIGGYIGPVSMTIAQNGVYETAGPGNEQQNFVKANLSWSNGMTLGLLYRTGTGYAIEGSYTFLSKLQNKPAKFLESPTYMNAVSTLSLIPSTGASDNIVAADGYYTLNSLNHGEVFSLHLLSRNEKHALNVTGGLGLALGQIDHQAFFNYAEPSGSVQKNAQEEQNLYLGPAIKFGIIKGLPYGFGIYGNCKLSTYAANARFTSLSENFIDAINQGYNVNTTGLYRLFYASQQASFGAYWMHELQSGGSVTLETVWSGGYNGDSTRLFSSVSGSQAAQLQGYAWSLLQMGLGVTF